MEENDVEVVLLLLGKGCPFEWVDHLGMSFLHVASEAGHVECARALLKAKADVNRATISGSTPLHLAALYGRVSCVKVCFSSFFLHIIAHSKGRWVVKKSY